MNEAAERFPTRFVAANGQRFEVIEAGEGDRLALLLHGFPENALSWHHQIAPLAEQGFRVWAVNQRGYGGSSKPSEVADYALPKLVADVAALIDASGAREVVLIAHDWGAVVAWCFAALRVRPLQRLVILNVPHPLCFARAVKRWRQARKSWYIAFFQIPRLPEWMLGRRRGAAVCGMFRGVPVDPSVMRTLRAQLADRRSATAMLNWYRALRRFGFGDLRGLRQPIETPTLVIWGENDIALDPICLEGTDRYVSDLRIERLPGISHWVQQHAPERVNALLRSFLGAGGKMS
ncbi:alpha/beta fold hydrolase [Acetobacteraceae bacterium KSS8]|uniref:Alpha/beta fold hydrolase n=1 Tax=Endosaccharibacter trunci TaxID=2812733 RepID=A0ABT1W7K0_9PROT|nr:alpha/beta fold hydrolase [Acetobacteraceae bacterium KSS8]